jgi:hypothetical protein
MTCGPPSDLDVVRVGQRRVQAPALTVERQDPVGRPVQDQRRDVDPLDVLLEVVQPREHARPRRPRRRPGTGVPVVAHGLLADPLAEVVVEVEEVPEQPGEPRGPVVEDRLPDGVDRRPVDPVRVLVGLDERRREALDEDATLQPVGPVGADVASQLPGTEREADQDGVAQIELGQQLVEVAGERVEVVALGRPARLTESAPVVGDHAMAGLQQRVHLGLPGPAVKRPAAQQHDRSAAAVVLVVQLDRRRVLLTDGDCAHQLAPTVAAAIAPCEEC